MLKSAVCIFVILILASVAVKVSAEPLSETVRETMKKAADFMMNTVSTHGGFVWQYSEDLSERWGEIPARETQIWTYGPSTPYMGELFLDVYRTTGDEQYLRYAERVADVLIWGQHPEGGWHYLIDFDMTGISEYYENVASRCWGWEEYYHYYGNCTFDDHATEAPTRYLMDLYTTTFNPVYREPLLKALNFILKAQFPNGAWPQRYPLMYEHVFQGIPDYTSYYTFNDNVIKNNIILLVDAWRKLGNEDYWKAAQRGMNFYIISQLAPPQAGWAEQYNHDMEPAQARSYEPASVMARQAVWSINDLLTFYRITGDRRYLAPIPNAIQWLEDSRTGFETGGNTHARYYKIRSNIPFYVEKTGTSIDNGKYVITTREGYTTWRIDIDSIRKRYQEVSALNPEQAKASFWGRDDNLEALPRTDTDTVKSVISLIDYRGAWITMIHIPNYEDPSKDGYDIRGINIGVFIKNMRILAGYVDQQR